MNPITFLYHDEGTTYLHQSFFPYLYLETCLPLQKEIFYFFGGAGIYFLILNSFMALGCHSTISTIVAKLATSIVF